MEGQIRSFYPLSLPDENSDKEEDDICDYPILEYLDPEEEEIANKYLLDKMAEPQPSEKNVIKMIEDHFSSADDDWIIIDEK